MSLFALSVYGKTLLMSRIIGGLLFSVRKLKVIYLDLLRSLEEIISQLENKFRRDSLLHHVGLKFEYQLWRRGGEHPRRRQCNRIDYMDRLTQRDLVAIEAVSLMGPFKAHFVKGWWVLKVNCGALPTVLSRCLLRSRL